MKRNAIRNYRTILVAANALVAFLSLTNLFFIAAGAIVVDVPDADDLLYEYDPANRTLLVDTIGGEVLPFFGRTRADSL